MSLKAHQKFAVYYKEQRAIEKEQFETKIMQAHHKFAIYYKQQRAIEKEQSETKKKSC